MGVRTGSSLICLVCLVLAGCTGGPSVDETIGIRAAFDGYKKAILDQDGEKAVTFVDQNTLDYYGKMLDLALRGHRGTVRARTTADRLMILFIRHRIPLESAKQMTGESLFAHAVDEGWIGRESVITNELGDIAVSGTSGTGVHISAGEESPIKWVFQKEGDRWKMDLTAVMPIADQALKQIIQESGLPDDEFLTEIIEAVSGKEVDDTVWDPMIQ